MSSSRRNFKIKKLDGNKSPRGFINPQGNDAGGQMRFYMSPKHFSKRE